MRTVRHLVPAVVWGGMPLLAYVVLAPAVWPRDDIDGLQLMSAMGLGAGLLTIARGSDLLSWRTELRTTVWPGAGIVALSLVLDVVLGGASTGTVAQQVLLGLALVVVAGGLVSVVRTSRRGFSPRPDPDRDARREAIRENVRREIAEIEQRARDGGR